MSAKSSSRRHHGGHRYSRLRIWKHRLKKRLHKDKWLAPAVILVVIALAASAFLMARAYRQQNNYEINAANLAKAGGSYRNIVYKGKPYRYNNRITTVLYAGIDSKGKIEPNNKFTVAPRADSITLVVMDEFNHRSTIISLNRNTITKIHRFTLDGKDRGKFRDFLTYAYSYGEGGSVSCQNLCEAVSDLMYGIPIKEYVVTNLDSIGPLAGIIGPVEVVVPNDDLTEQGYIKGERVVIDADNLERFVRSRDTKIDFSNNGRMERQRAYIDGAYAQIRDMLVEHPYEAWDKVQRVEDYIQTNIRRNRYLDLTKVLKNTAHGEWDYYTPEGEDVVGRRYDEFYVDEDALLDRIVELFYIRD